MPAIPVGVKQENISASGHCDITGSITLATSGSAAEFSLQPSITHTIGDFQVTGSAGDAWGVFVDVLIHLLGGTSMKDVFVNITSDTLNKTKKALETDFSNIKANLSQSLFIPPV